jgi:hypothetical protein
MRVVYSRGLIAVPVCQPHAEPAAQPSCWMRATCSVDGQYFSSSSGPDTIRQRFDRRAAAAGLSRITFHDYADLRVMPTSVRSSLWRTESRLMRSA